MPEFSGLENLAWYFVFGAVALIILVVAIFAMIEIGNSITNDGNNPIKNFFVGLGVTCLFFVITASTGYGLSLAVGWYP